MAVDPPHRSGPAASRRAGGSYRWAVLAAGTAAQTSFSAVVLGVAVVLPALRAKYGLSIGQAGVLLAAFNFGPVLSMLPWGIATDRFGERVTVTVGLVGSGAALMAAGQAPSFETLAVLLFLSGLSGAVVGSASGRAVMQWFPQNERGLALGIRHAAIPIGGATAALAMPHLVDAGGTPLALEALGVGCLLGALAAALVLRDAGAAAGLADDEHQIEIPIVKDRRLWRLMAASVLMLAPQMAMFGFSVLFLHDARGLVATSAAAVLATIQVLGIAGRIGVGRWSDVVGSRLGPLRIIAAASATSAVAIGLCTGARLQVLVPVLIVGGLCAMVWNGLLFAAAAEVAGRARTGAALGLQQTGVAIGATILAPLFAKGVDVIGWGWAWGLTAIGPMAAIVVVRGMRG